MDLLLLLLLVGVGGVFNKVFNKVLNRTIKTVEKVLSIHIWWNLCFVVKNLLSTLYFPTSIVYFTLFTKSSMVFY